MTEIALAMAMGFFSVMVLTAMSMGVGVGKRVDVSTAMLAPPATASGAADSLKDDDILVIYDGRRFYGRDLKPLDPGTIDRRRRVVLAVAPELAMSKAMAARQRLGAKRLVVTTLDADWRKALKGLGHGG